jgi:hypothetical protein
MAALPKALALQHGDDTFRPVIHPRPPGRARGGRAAPEGAAEPRGAFARDQHKVGLRPPGHSAHEPRRGRILLCGVVCDVETD